MGERRGSASDSGAVHVVRVHNLFDEARGRCASPTASVLVRTRYNRLLAAEPDLDDGRAEVASTNDHVSVACDRAIDGRHCQEFRGSVHFHIVLVTQVVVASV